MGQDRRDQREANKAAKQAAIRAAMSVKERREAQSRSGISMKEYKAGARGAKNQASYDIKNQTVDKASDYDFGAYKSDSVNGGEIMALRNQGLSRSEVRAAAEASGLTLGKKVQSRFARWDAKAAANGGGGTTTPDNGGGSPTPSDSQNPTVEVDSSIDSETNQENTNNNPQTSYVEGDYNDISQNQENTNSNEAGDNTNETNLSQAKAVGLKDVYVDSIIKTKTKQTNKNENPQMSEVYGSNNNVTQNQTNSNINKAGDNYNYTFGLW